MTTAAPTAPPKNLFTADELKNTQAAQFDFAKAAGQMTGPAEYSVNKEDLTSGRLSQLLSQDNPYIQMARTRAAQSANRRGLLNSSIAAGAGEAAAIESALPIAQSDSGALIDAQRFNAESKNLFSRDQNNFMREGALKQYGTVAEMEQQGMQNAFARDERVADQAFRTSEREGTQTFQAQRDTENFNRELQRLGYENQLKMSNVPIEFSLQTAQQNSQQIAAIMNNPELSPEAKKSAIENIVAYSNNTLAWAEQFFGVPSITRLQSGIGSAPSATPPVQIASAPAPAVAPAPAPAVDPNLWWNTYNPDHNPGGF
jgi:hypothetical protein